MVYNVYFWVIQLSRQHDAEDYDQITTYYYVKLGCGIKDVGEEDPLYACVIFHSTHNKSH